MSNRLVIIGNGMAATRLVAELSADHGEPLHITVIGEEDQPGYNRVLLSRLLGGEISEGELVTHDRDWYQSRAVNLVTGHRVVALDREQKRLILDNQSTVHYDRLVFATGARPFLPPVTGLQLDGVMAFRHIQDCHQIQQRVASSARVVVVGGGLLGLEAAHGINRLGGNVTVIHNADWLLNRQIDQPAADLLQSSLTQRGITVITAARLASISDDGCGNVSGILLENGETIECDAVVMATGITPNVELAEESGLQINRGICVDGWLRTSDSAVFALGECAEVEGHCIGMVEPAWQQAAVLAQVLRGQLPEPWRQRPIPTQLKVSGEEVYSAGEFDDPRADSLTWHDPVSGEYRHLKVRNQVVVGAVLYGNSEDAAFYYGLMDKAVSVKPIRQRLLFGQQACETVS